MRNALVSLALASLSLSIATPGLTAVDPQVKKLRIVVFGGHPDDPESGAGGLIAVLAQQGHEVILAYGTVFRGGRQFFDRPEAEVRREEATAACKVLGATPKFFPFAHETLQADAATVRTVTAWLDDVKPDIVVTHWPLDTHPNHHVVSSLVWQRYQRKGGWNLYFFEVMTDQQTLGFQPDLYLDLEPVRDLKRRALLEHKSQSPEAIWTAHERMHRNRGAECGVIHAEAYRLLEAKPGCALLPVTFLHRKGTNSSANSSRRDNAPTISSVRRDGDGFLSHSVSSAFQGGTTEIRVLPPDRMDPTARYPVIYVLPVEARRERSYGDGLLEVRKQDLHNQLKAIFVAPTFSHRPWYADHPSDPEIRQESYLLRTVVPFVDSHYPTQAAPGGRLLLGFSKSGWGAFSLLLRHPDQFGKAVAWDAPFMQGRPDKYGMGAIFGTQENFERYRLTNLVEQNALDLRDRTRLFVLGYGNFRDEHERFHALLKSRGIPHVYVDGPQRPHRWDSGWVPEAARALLEDGETKVAAPIRGNPAVPSQR